MDKQIAELARRGIIALPNVGYTMSDRRSDVDEQRRRPRPQATTEMPAEMPARG